MESRETSSTFGLKTETWALLPASERRESQGESWVWLKKKDSLEENARPNVKPSLLRTLESEHGSNTSFVSESAAATITIIAIVTPTIMFFTIFVFFIMISKVKLFTFHPVPPSFNVASPQSKRKRTLGTCFCNREKAGRRKQCKINNRPFQTPYLNLTHALTKSYKRKTKA